MTYLFIDTNIFLHFQYFDELPWNEIIDTNEFQLLIAPVVIDELDKHKRNSNSKIAQRAKTVLTRIHAVVEDPEAYPLQYIHKRPEQKTLDEYHLDRNEKDDLLLATIIEFSLEYRDEVILISYDTGPLIRAKSVNIKSIKIHEKYQLPIEESEDKKTIRKLTQELNTIKNALPKVILTFDNGGEFIDVAVNPVNETVEQYVNRCLPEETGNIHKMDYRDPAAINKILDEVHHQPLSEALQHLREYNDIFNQLTEEQVDKYNYDLDIFIANYELFLEKRYEYERILSMSVPVQLILNNVGTAPAEDIDIFLEFPKGFKVINKELFPKPPKAPELPFRPRNKSDIEIKSSRSSILSSLPAPLNGYKAEIYDEHLRKADVNGYIGKYQLESLKHYNNCEIYPLIIVFNEQMDVSNFQISYRIVIANLPKAITGNLNVKVSQIAD